MFSPRQPESHSVVFHPVLFGLFPLFSLFSANSGWVAPHEVLLPAAGILSIAFALWLALCPILSRRKRGLVISLFWLPFFGYGTTLDFVRAQLDFRAMLSPAQAIGAGLLSIVVASGLLYSLRRAPWTLIPLTRFLNRASALVIAVSLASCLIAAARRQAPPETEGTRNTTASAHAPKIAVQISPDKLAALPNIYFIICDAYPRSDHLKAYFGYDNSPFLDQLRDRGFYVAEKSRSNYCNTLPSIASTLNLDYLDPKILDPENFRKNYRELIDLVRDNLVVRTLKAHGYEYVAIPSGMFPTMMVGADRFIHPGTFKNPEAQQELLDGAPTRPARPGAFDLTEYQQTIINMTPVRSIMNRMVQLWWYQLVPFSLEELESLRREGRPMFVFAHLLAPHVPHAYDAQGNFVETFPPFKEGWRTVTQYLDTRLIEVVDAIRANEPNSIIIIQGDHGSNASMPDARNKLVEPWAGEWPDYVRDRSANLSACHLPGKGHEGLLYPELTPVNLFRIIFDTYLETNYGKLEDVTYLSPQNSDEIVRITEVY
jgi:hypothetical protein